MLTAKWFVRWIISFLVLQGVLGDEEEEFPECDSELYENQYDDHHTSGMVNSPDYHGNGYTVGARCQFTINIPQGHRMNLHFGALDIEPSDFCSLDSLQINDTLTVKTLCGMMPPTEPIFVKEGVKSVHLLFRSDKNQTRPDHMPNRRGFHIQFSTSSQLVDPCNYTETNRCRNGRCYHESMKCNGHDDCGDGTDEEGCDLSELPLPPVECGEVPLGPDYVLDQPDGITGEKEVMQGTWPWQVSLLDRYTYFSYTCGGTLIKPQWILTAARCFEEHPDPNYWQVHVGVHQKYQYNPYVPIRYVERIIVWPNKTADDLGDNFDSNDDIALIKLNAPVQLGNHLVHHVCLPQSDREVQPGTRCYAAGWGATARRSKYLGGPPDDALKVIDLLAMSTSNCTYDSSTQICVENPGCQSACNGESGNPLVAKSGSKWYVVGIGSNRMEGKNRSAATNETIVYTKVSDKAEWIRKMMDKYS